MGRARVYDLCRSFDDMTNLSNDEYEEASKAAAKMVPAEAAFYRAVLRKKRCKIMRAGWPDFFLYNEATGKSYCVEVKSETDRIHPSQRKMFAALEQAGLQTFIWCPRDKDKLTPWREFKTPRPKKIVDYAKV